MLNMQRTIWIYEHCGMACAIKCVCYAEEALSNIAETTVQNIVDIFERGECPNELCYRGGSAEDCKNGKCFG